MSDSASSREWRSAAFPRATGIWRRRPRSRIGRTIGVESRASPCARRCTRPSVPNSRERRFERRAPAASSSRAARRDRACGHRAAPHIGRKRPREIRQRKRRTESRGQSQPNPNPPRARRAAPTHASCDDAARNGAPIRPWRIFVQAGLAAPPPMLRSDFSGGAPSSRRRR